MDERTRIGRHLGRLAALALIAALAAATLAAAPASAQSTVKRAAAGCVIAKLNLFSHYSVRLRKRYIVFKPTVTCTGGQKHKATLTIRRRRFGPDQTVASREFPTYPSSKTYGIGAGCKKGQTFNGDLWVKQPPNGPTLHAVKKNVSC